MLQATSRSPHLSMSSRWVPWAARCAMKDLDRRCVAEAQIECVGPAGDQCFQLWIELAVQPDCGCELDRVIPFGWCARRFVIKKKYSLLPRMTDQPFLDHQFGRLPENAPKLITSPGRSHDPRQSFFRSDMTASRAASFHEYLKEWRVWSFLISRFFCSEINYHTVLC